MNYDNYSMGGMHFFWWIFIVVILLLIAALFYKKSDRKVKKEIPLDILKRRMALGEISKEDFLEKKKILEA